jgi:hypothetical protein
MKMMNSALFFTIAMMLVGKAESTDSPARPNIVLVMADD